MSSDIVGNPASSHLRLGPHHASRTAATSRWSRWYDNEWGFSNRVIDTLELLTTR
ncbi:hypothetical protein SVIOM74S_01170 [Streptomyces violarus]